MLVEGQTIRWRLSTPGRTIHLEVPRVETKVLAEVWRAVLALRRGQYRGQWRSRLGYKPHGSV